MTNTLLPTPIPVGIGDEETRASWRCVHAVKLFRMFGLWVAQGGEGGFRQFADDIFRNHRSIVEPHLN